MLVNIVKKDLHRDMCEETKHIIYKLVLHTYIII